jgi:crotonobetaine/carnitine-CoA ligase
MEALESLFGIAKAGAVVVPLNPFLKGEFLAHQLRDSEPVALIADSRGSDAVASVRGRGVKIDSLILVDGETVPESALDVFGDSVFNFETISSQTPNGSIDVASTSPVAIMYTSGTTGLSKGCVLSHRYYTKVGAAFQSVWNLSESDVVFAAYQLFHASGQIAALMTALSAGASLVIAEEFHASTYIRDAAECDATIAWGVGAMAHAILRQPRSDRDRTHRLRYCNFAPLGSEAQVEFAARFGVPVTGQMFAQTECMPISMLPIGEDGVPGSGGRPTPGLEVAILDEDGEPCSAGDIGEIVVRPSEAGRMFDGYWQNPDATADALRLAWHHTGDLGRLDEQGYLFFVDRKKDSLRRRGENVSSMELERAIERHPAVKEVAVHGVPSSMSDEDIKACIVLEEGLEIGAEDLHEYFSFNLPFFAVPRYVEFLSELPKTPTLRVQKHLLRERDLHNCWDFDSMGLTVAHERRRAGAG